MQIGGLRCVEDDLEVAGEVVILHDDHHARPIVGEVVAGDVVVVLRPLAPRCHQLQQRVAGNGRRRTVTVDRHRTGAVTGHDETRANVRRSALL